MDNFPFPSREQAANELRRDPVFHKIHEDEAGLEAIVARAWNTGAEAARNIFNRYGDCGMRKIVKDCGISVEKMEKDYVVGGTRYFSDYFSGSAKRIVLYMHSINKWAEQNGVDMEKAEELILAHELFHHLECTELGLTSQQYLVPMVRLGSVCIGKTGVRALSEIGSCAFARTYFELLQSSQSGNHTTES